MKEGETQSLQAFLNQAKSAQERKQMLMARYREQLQKDKQKMGSADAARPQSRAYQSLDLNANNTMTAEEEKLNMQSYHKESSEKAKTPAEFFKDKMRGSLLDSGLYKSGVVDQNLKTVDAESDIPDELKKAYFRMVKAGMKTRLANDNDWQEMKTKAASRYEYLGGM